mmetsp:Transcript_10061/g.16702  ORF Transcript_10061/g.16702 Transcript_10061/m.16702 type:complete len:309 (+) Transcript_10061:431-1357(+)
MANDWEFMVEVEEHLLAKRESFGIPSDFMASVIKLHEVTGKLFGPIKTKTMDWAVSEYHKIRERGDILASEIAANQKGLKFNILEAAINENLNGYTDNAMTGIALAIIPPDSVRLVGNNSFLEYELSQEWVSLYESWNLAFITGNLPYLHVLIPKLLIPAVIDAEPNDYIFNRALSLWVSINFFLYAQLIEEEDYAIPNFGGMSQLWGEINNEFANALVSNEMGGADLSKFQPLLGIMTYAILWDQFKVLLIASDVITPEDGQHLSELLRSSRQQLTVNEILRKVVEYVKFVYACYASPGAMKAVLSD